MLSATAFALAALVTVCAADAHQSRTDKMHNQLKIIKQKAAAAHSDALVILHDGKVTEGCYFDKPRGVIETMSVTKSVVAVAVGCAMLDGKITSLDQPVCEFFPAWQNTPKAKITLRHLMCHTSGLADKATTEDIYASTDMVKLALDADLKHPPGEYFFYSNKAVNLLPAIVEKATGEHFNDYIRKKIFTPLAIKDFYWAKDKAGNTQGFAGLGLRAADLAKIGQLMLQRGEWNGRRILSEDYVAECTKPQHANCGLLWWLDDTAPKTYSAHGYLGQAVVICPSAKLVCVRQIRNTSHKSEADNFAEFEPLVKKLARTSL